MSWLRTTTGFVNSETGVTANVAVNDSQYRLRINGQQLAGSGYATEQEALDALERVLLAHTLT